MADTRRAGRNPAARPTIGREVALAAAVALLLATASWFATATAQAQAVYSWKDQRGVVHFSNSGVPAEHKGKARVRVMHPHSPPTTRHSNSKEIPLLAMGGRRFVHASFEGRYATRDVVMIVDTGAQITMIDEKLASDLALRVEQEAGIVGVTGAAKGWIGRVRRIRLGDHEVRNWPVMVGPQQGTLLLGMDVLDKLQLSIGRDRLESK